MKCIKEQMSTLQGPLCGCEWKQSNVWLVVYAIFFYYAADDGGKASLKSTAVIAQRSFRIATTHIIYVGSHSVFSFLPDFVGPLLLRWGSCCIKELWSMNLETYATSTGVEER